MSLDLRFPQFQRWSLPSWAQAILAGLGGSSAQLGWGGVRRVGSEVERRAEKRTSNTEHPTRLRRWAPPGQASNIGRFCLELGEVCNSAKVTLNGRELGTLIMHPYRVDVPAGLLKPVGNTLEIEVTNLAANRIRDLDQRKVSWKNFTDINFVNIGYKPFDASAWPVFDSGLLGPVALVPLQP